MRLTFPSMGETALADARPQARDGEMLRRLSSSALIAAAACALTGCYSVPPYGAYPNMYAPGAPAYRQMPPRAGYVLPGEIIHSQPATFSTAPLATPANGIQSAPQVSPKAATPATENPVPEPRDPSANGGKQTDRSTSLFDESTRPTLAASSFDYESEATDSEFQRPRVASVTRTTRPTPVDRSVRSTESEITQVGFQQVATRDPEFRWVQGFLQYNARMQSWHLLYDPNPGEDPNGGDVKLTGRLPFTPADHNKPFRVWGRFHNSLLDELNKPQYVVDRAERIVPNMLESR